MKIKKCPVCSSEKPLSEFYKRNDRPDGYQYLCKACQSKKQKKWRKVHGKKWDHEYQWRDRPTYLLKVRNYRKTPSGYYSSFKTANKEKVKFTREEFLIWDTAQRRECFYCETLEENIKNSIYLQVIGRKNWNRLTLDRKNSFLPYTLENIVYACWLCNDTKSNIFLSDEFKKLAMTYIKPKYIIPDDAKQPESALS